MKRVHLLISGDVTGVGFRLSSILIARDLGLVGWVGNTPDSGVEIVAEGTKEKLENLVKWARRGPATARVEEVEVEWEKATGEFKEFELKR